MRYYVSSASACADAGIFTKCGGGGGGVEDPGPPDSKKLEQCCFVILLFFSPHLQLIEQFYRGNGSQGPMVYFLENNNYPRFQRMSNILRGGGRGPTFFLGGGRPNANFEIVISPGPPIPSLYPCMLCLHL